MPTGLAPHAAAVLLSHARHGADSLKQALAAYNEEYAHIYDFSSGAATRARDIDSREYRSAPEFTESDGECRGDDYWPVSFKRLADISFDAYRWGRHHEYIL